MEKGRKIFAVFDSQQHGKSKLCGSVHQKRWRYGGNEAATFGFLDSRGIETEPLHG